MATFDFPDSPTLNQTYTFAGVTWKWNGNVWKKQAELGATGLKGNKGDKGDKGEKGQKGQKGIDGAFAGKGQKGQKGERGDVEQAGNKGQKGTTGTSVKGQKGVSGTPGTSVKGQKGASGTPGTSVKGSKGAQGDSIKGEPGDSVKGEPGVDSTGPIGQIVVWSGSIGSNYSNIPDGYLLCNGTQIPNGTAPNIQGKSGDFSALYSIVGAYIPDLENTFIMGAAETGVGDKGGSADAVLITHDHTQIGGSGNDDGANTLADTKVPGSDGGGSDGVFGNMININTTGIDASGNVYRSGHNLPTPTNVSGTNANLPPYYKLAYIIKFSDSGEAQKGQRAVARVCG